MIQFITSSFMQDQAIDPSNHFIDNLIKHWQSPVNFIYFAADPEDAETTDRESEEMQQAFLKAGFAFSTFTVFDGRKIRAYAEANGLTEEEAGPKALADAVARADVFYLAGGHCPTEHAFLEECHVREALGIEGDAPLFSGIFLSLSAGSINAAKEAYLLPELPGESIDPDFKRFAKGLGLTQLQIVPHWQYVKTVELDGKPFTKGVLEGDSQDRPLYLLPDGSYFMINEAGVTELFGQAEIMEKGCIRPMESGVVYSEFPVFSELSLKKKGKVNRLLDRLIVGNYDMIFTVEENGEHLFPIYVSPYYQSKGICPMCFGHYQDLLHFYGENMIVPEEREVMQEDLTFERVLWEIRRDGECVRTAHIDTESGIQAQKLTFRLLEDYAPGRSVLLLTFVNVAEVVDHDWMTDLYSRSGFLRETARILLSNCMYIS